MKELVAASYNFLLQIPSKLAIQCKKWCVFWLVLHPIWSGSVRTDGVGWGLEGFT